jgi:hypothetical protein
MRHDVRASWLRRSAQAAVVLAALLIMYVVLRCAVHRPTLPSREAGERDTCAGHAENE